MLSDKNLFRNSMIVALPLESFAIKVEKRKQGPWIYVYINGIKCLLSENTYNNMPKRLYYDFVHANKEIMLEVYAEDDMNYPGKAYLFKARIENKWVYFETM